MYIVTSYQPKLANVRRSSGFFLLVFFALTLPFACITDIPSPLAVSSAALRCRQRLHAQNLVDLTESKQPQRMLVETKVNRFHNIINKCKLHVIIRSAKPMTVYLCACSNILSCLRCHTFQSICWLLLTRIDPVILVPLRKGDDKRLGNMINQRDELAICNSLTRQQDAC